MTRLAHLILRLAAWLSAVDAPADTSEPYDWSDVPAYHPATNTGR